MSLVTPSLIYYPDPTVGRPVFNGQIFVGDPDTDPEIPANQKQAVLKLEDGSTVNVGQPVLTNSGGVVTYNGSYAVLTTDGDFSLKVLNNNGAQVYYIPNNADLFDASQISYGPIPISVEKRLDDLDVADYDELRALLPAELEDGQTVTVTNMYIAGQGQIRKVTSHGLTDNGGTIIVLDSDTYWEREITEYINVQWFGATGEDDAIDETAFFQAAVDSAALDGVQSNYHHKAVFVPTPIDGYKITGVNLYQRVDIIGESKWNTRLVIDAQGEYAFEQPRRVTNLFFDGVTIANGAIRIDQAGWNRATDRANTGVIMGPADQSFQGGHGIVDECRFNALGVCVERGDSIDTTVRNNYILTCWHGIFSRADGANSFASMLYDVKNYISQNQGIGIGFYQNANGYSQWACENNVVEVCCMNAAHDGINGFIDSGGASFITPGCRNLYIEGDETTYPAAIGIRSNLFFADGFVIQGTGTPFQVFSGTNSFWRLTNGQIFETVDTYDITFPTGGRNYCLNISFSNGLNAAALGNTTLIDCSGTNVLPDGNSNYYMDDGQHYVGNQGGTPTISNRRASNGLCNEWWRNGVLAQGLEDDISTATPRDSGTTDGTGVNQLIDSTQNFTSTVSVGDVVKNTDNNTFATITSVDSDTQLTLDADIIVSGENYSITFAPTSQFTNPLGIPVLTVAEMTKYPVATFAGKFVFVTDDATEGYTMAFSDGTNWNVLSVSGIMS